MAFGEKLLGGEAFHKPTVTSTDEAESQEPTSQPKAVFRPTKLGPEIISEIQRDLAKEVDDATASDQKKLKEKIAEVADAVLLKHNVRLARSDRETSLEGIYAEVFGLGPLEPLLDDPSITEIVVVGPKKLYVERNGKLEAAHEFRFRDDDHLRRTIQNIVNRVGRRVDEASPICDARLADGSRVCAVLPPIAVNGPNLTIRKFKSAGWKVDELVANGTATADMFAFLRAAVRARLNIIVAGGTGSGKTTCLNLLSSFIQDDHRVVTIEDAAELKLEQDNVTSLETRPPNIEGMGAIPMQDLVKHALRMRPDRIVVGECRGGEALDMLQAMGTGHDGSLTTVHANDPDGVVDRIETLVLMSGKDLPYRAIRDQISRGIDLVVHQKRLEDGTRKIVAIAELHRTASGEIELSPIFEWQTTGTDPESGKVYGNFRVVQRPKCLDRLNQANQRVSEEIFNRPDNITALPA